MMAQLFFLHFIIPQMVIVISALCFRNFHTGVCLPDNLDLFLLKNFIFPLPSSSWQPSPSSHQVTVVSVFLGCHCKFAARKEFSISGDYLCCLGCSCRVRKDDYGPTQRKLGNRNPLPITFPQL